MRFRNQKSSSLFKMGNSHDQHRISISTSSFAQLLQYIESHLGQKEYQNPLYLLKTYIEINSKQYIIK
jgi:hypothetical protein